ncbi:MAG: thioredoxin fold domain-containing protein [Chromatiales bacterium]|nr:thioredoxin fold domain-containing protein [Chromatiales bacterium]
MCPISARMTALVLGLVLGTALAGGGPNERINEVVFADDPAFRNLKHPPWFKKSFYDLREDLEDARTHGKFGLMLYFGQEHCAYCEAFLEHDLGKLDIESLVRRQFDVIGFDIYGAREVTLPDGQKYTEQELSVFFEAQFTPTLLFIGPEGNEVFRLRGYYPPYQFRAAINYVTDGFYRSESFRDFLARADPTMSFEEGGLNYFELAAPPPLALDRSRMPAQRPLAVFFEQGDCHACDALHTDPLNDGAVLARLRDFDVVQLDMWSQSPVITPAGERTTARDWARKLGLFFTPTIVLYDERGKEIIRVDSVVQQYRLAGVLEFVQTRAYLEQPNFQRWRYEKRLESYRERHGTEFL